MRPFLSHVLPWTRAGTLRRTPPPFVPRAAVLALVLACVVPLLLVTLCAMTVGHMPGTIEVSR